MDQGLREGAHMDHNTEKTLVLLHTEADGTLARPALECLALAASLGKFDLAVSGAGASAAAKSAEGSAGRVLCVAGDEFAAPRSSTDAAAAEALIRTSGATLVLAPGTSRWSRALPMAAARLNGVIDTHAVGLEVSGDAIQVKRWFYRQRIEGVVTRTRCPWIVVVEPGAFTAAPALPAQDTVETELVEVAVAPRTTVEGTVSTTAGEQTIRPDAELLFVAGAGWTKKQKDGQVHFADAADRIQGFVHKSKCSLGSSKSLVDLSCEGEAVLPFLTHLHQVGQTGSTPRHKKGLATCCHGEEPHVVGWRFINERRAVNLDPNCGWARGKADVLYVADAFEVMKALNALLD
jgi:electron transfer flavoprotein alpha subunit